MLALLVLLAAVGTVHAYKADPPTSTVLVSLQAVVDGLGGPCLAASSLDKYSDEQVPSVQLNTCRPLLASGEQQWQVLPVPADVAPASVQLKHPVSNTCLLVLPPPEQYVGQDFSLDWPLLAPCDVYDPLQWFEFLATGELQTTLGSCISVQEDADWQMGLATCSNATQWLTTPVRQGSSSFVLRPIFFDGEYVVQLHDSDEFICLHPMGVGGALTLAHCNETSTAVGWHSTPDGIFFVNDTWGGHLVLLDIGGCLAARDLGDGAGFVLYAAMCSQNDTAQSWAILPDTPGTPLVHLGYDACFTYFFDADGTNSPGYLFSQVFAPSDCYGAGVLGLNTTGPSYRSSGNGSETGQPDGNSTSVVIDMYSAALTASVSALHRTVVRMSLPDIAMSGYFADGILVDNALLVLISVLSPNSTAVDATVPLLLPSGFFDSTSTTLSGYVQAVAFLPLVPGVNVLMVAVPRSLNIDLDWVSVTADDYVMVIDTADIIGFPAGPFSLTDSLSAPLPQPLWTTPLRFAGNYSFVLEYALATRSSPYSNNASNANPDTIGVPLVAALASDSTKPRDVGLFPVFLPLTIRAGLVQAVAPVTLDPEYGVFTLQLSVPTIGSLDPIIQEYGEHLPEVYQIILEQLSDPAVQNANFRIVSVGIIRDIALTEPVQPSPTLTQVDTEVSLDYWRFAHIVGATESLLWGDDTLWFVRNSGYRILSSISLTPSWWGPFCDFDCDVSATLFFNRDIGDIVFAFAATMDERLYLEPELAFLVECDQVYCDYSDHASRVHFGLSAAYDEVFLTWLSSSVDAVLARVINVEAQLNFVGIGGGGALAVLASLQFAAQSNGTRVSTTSALYTFGAPAVGDEAFAHDAFAAAMAASGMRAFVFENDGDSFAAATASDEYYATLYSNGTYQFDYFTDNPEQAGLAAMYEQSLLLYGQQAFGEPVRDPSMRDYSLLSCVATMDPTGHVLFDIGAWTVSLDNNSPLNCNRMCRSSSALSRIPLVFGLHGSQCFCASERQVRFDDYYGSVSNTTAQAEACNAPCPGDTSQSCGGADPGAGTFLSLYSSEYSK